MRGYALDSMAGLRQSWWLLTRAEQQRVHTLASQWKKKNKNATEAEEILFESLLRCHVFEQRLINNTTTFWGDETVHRYHRGDKALSVDADDMAKKEKEFKDLWFQMMKMKVELLKLSLANSINLDIGTDVTTMFHALDKQSGKNGSSNQKEGNSNSRTGNRIVR